MRTMCSLQLSGFKVLILQSTKTGTGTITGLYLFNKYRFLLSVGSLIVLTYPTHPTVHKCCELAAGVTNGSCLLEKITPCTSSKLRYFILVVAVGLISASTFPNKDTKYLQHKCTNSKPAIA